MALTIENRKQLLSYITKAKAKGYDDVKIIVALQKVGYADEDIATLPVVFPKRLDIHNIYAERKWLLLIGCVGLIILLTFLFLTLQRSCEDPLACFLEKANRCEAATYTFTYGTSTITTSSTPSCSLLKYFSSLDPQEPLAVQDLLLDKTLECTYERDSLETSDVLQLTANLENCKGDLVDAILILQK